MLLWHDEPNCCLCCAISCQCWKGYHQSLRPCQGGLFLNVDTAVGAFNKPIKVDQYLEEILGPSWSSSRGLDRRGEKRVKLYLKNILVCTLHISA